MTWSTGKLVLQSTKTSTSPGAYRTTFPINSENINSALKISFSGIVIAHSVSLGCSALIADHKKELG